MNVKNTNSSKTQKLALRLSKFRKKSKNKKYQPNMLICL